MAKDFFSIFREKLTTSPREDFDDRFWMRFEKEFGSPKVSWLDWRMAVPALSVALVGILYLSKRITPESETQLASSLIKDLDVLEDLELFEDLDEIALTASDEDWKILLEEEGV